MPPRTPWGELQALRDRHAALRGSHRREAKRSQTELLFAAMVVCCAERGFENTSVADLLEVSGLSRGTFYANFDDKLDCFCAAEAEILRMALATVRRRLRADEERAEARARAALEAVVELIVAQPAAARMCLVDCYSAGERGVAPIRDAIDAIIELCRQVLAELEFGAATSELARGIISGFYEVIYNRIESHRESELPELVPTLWDWAISYRPVPGPLRGGSRRPSRRGVGRLPPFAAYSPEQRIIRAFAAVAAEKGYPATRIADVCARASISQSTFYEHFADRADLLRAALDSSGAQLLAATLPAARRTAEWPAAIVKVTEAACAFLAAEPDFARLRLIEVYAAGPEALAIREEIGQETWMKILARGPAEAADLPPIAAEATRGAALGVCIELVRDGRAGRIMAAAPLLAYLILAPLLGAARAYEIATG